MPKFELRKWYFDCVTSEGTVFIGYAAKIKYGLIKFNYGSTIIKETNKKIIQKQSFSFGKLNEKKDVLEWHNISLDVNGKWFSNKKCKKITLYKGKEGLIDWQCLKPNAKVLINHAGKNITGIGYVEQLYLTIPPWKLPFDELRWGRFISNNQKNYFIWIDWKGKSCKNWIFTNKCCTNGAIKNNIILNKQEKLILVDSLPIRCENVSKTLLGPFQILLKLFPKKLQLIKENKYISNGILQINKSKINGSSINEVVKWY